MARRALAVRCGASVCPRAGLVRRPPAHGCAAGECLTGGQGASLSGLGFPAFPGAWSRLSNSGPKPLT